MITKSKTKYGPASVGEPREVPLDWIELNRNNPRQDFDPVELQHLACSLDRRGLLQRCVVRCIGPDRYQLLAGERRYRAAQAAGWKILPVEVRNCTDGEALEIIAEENMARKDLNPLERAQMIRLLHLPAEEGGAGLTHAEIGARFGKSAEWSMNGLRLLAIPDPWNTLVRRGEVSETKARILLGYLDQPLVMKAVEADFRENPEAWGTRDQFATNVREIAARFGRVVERTRQAIAKNGSPASGAAAQAVSLDAPPAAIAPTRRAPAVSLDPTPPSGKRGRVLTDDEVELMLQPLAKSREDLAAVRDRCQQLLAKLPRKGR